VKLERWTLNVEVPFRRASRAELLRALEVALDAIRADRVRTRSAIVALALSMAIVVCLTTLVERGRAATIRSLERAGLNNLYLVARPQTRSGAPAAPLVRADAERLRAFAPVRSVVAMRVGSRTMTARGAPFDAPLYAVSGPIAEVFGVRVRSGRSLADLDVARQTPYCLLGSDVAKTAGLPTSVGAVVNAGVRSYEVIGELQEAAAEGATAGEIPVLDWNRAVVVPLGTEPQASSEAEARYPIDVAALQLPSAIEADRTARLLERMDPQRYGPAGSVRIASPVQTLRQYKQTRRTFDRIVWLVGLLTAASAVLGISNLLSASVLARTREIGLRRAVGARAGDIVLQFQAEGLLLGLLGGGLGLLAGLAISLVTPDRGGSGATLSLFSFSGLAVLCVVIGVLTGIRPSQRASRIEPAQALREG
jgi:putative ABC transport system permease protein